MCYHTYCISTKLLYDSPYNRGCLQTMLVACCFCKQQYEGILYKLSDEIDYVAKQIVSQYTRAYNFRPNRSCRRLTMVYKQQNKTNVHALLTKIITNILRLTDIVSIYKLVICQLPVWIPILILIFLLIVKGKEIWFIT